MKYTFFGCFGKNKKFIQNNLKNKKAIMAMDALIGTILSVIALFFLLQLMYMFFFQNNDENFKIAQSDAQSIVDFVNTYSSDNKNNPYFDNENCFFMLKLQNLENFQVQKDAKKTYSYVITQKEVLIIDNENIKLFEENLQLNSNIVKKSYKFNKPIQIKKDETDDLSIPKFDFAFIEFGGSSPLIINNLLKEQFIELKQGENLMGKGYDNNNILYPFIYQENIIEIEKNPIDWYKSGVLGGQSKNFKLVNGGNLVYSKKYNTDRNILFVTNSELSNIYVKNNLCSKKQLESQNKNIVNSKEENLLSIDYLNKKVSFSCSFEKNTFIKLIWENGYKCESKEEKYCLEFLPQININDYNSMFNGNNPKDTKLSQFCTPIRFNTDKVQYFFVVEDSLNKKINADQKLNFNFIFKKDISGFEGKKITDLTNKEKEDNLFIDSKSFFKTFFGGNSINGCNENKYNLCNDLYVKNGKVYSYIIDSENLEFYSFNELWLKKKYNEKGEISFYFMNKLQTSKKENLDSYGSAIGNGNGFWGKFISVISFGSNDDKSIYVLNLKDVNIVGIERKEFTIYLTPQQLYAMDEYKEK